jgi:hypothetical protein
MDPEQDQWTDDESVEDQEAGGSDGEDTGAESPGDTGQEPDTKRINDLMSKWQKAEERANKAEKLLKEQQPGSAQPTGEAAMWIEVMREAARDQVFGSDPRFAKYQLESSLIEGTTPEQMRQSATRLGAIIDRIESDAQQSVLKKHGLSPDQRGGAAQRLPDFGQMSDEEFARAVAKAKGQ